MYMDNVVKIPRTVIYSLLPNIDLPFILILQFWSQLYAGVNKHYMMIICKFISLKYDENRFKWNISDWIMTCLHLNQETESRGYKIAVLDCWDNSSYFFGFLIMACYQPCLYTGTIYWSAKFQGLQCIMSVFKVFHCQICSKKKDKFLMFFFVK